AVSSEVNARRDDAGAIAAEHELRETGNLADRALDRTHRRHRPSQVDGGGGEVERAVAGDGDAGTHRAAVSARHAPSVPCQVRLELLELEALVLEQAEQAVERAEPQDPR